MRILRKILYVFLFIILLLNAAILISGKTYIYKGIAYTYLQGRTGPDIEDFKKFPAREIKTGQPQPWPVGFNYNNQQIPQNSLTTLEELETIAFLVIKDDSLRYEKYFDGFEQASVTNSFSMAKTITSILTGIAIDEGKIKSVEQPVGDFLPQFKTGKNANLKIKHLLTMSSGMDFDEDYVSPFAYPAGAYYGSDLEKLTYKYKLIKEPGKIFEYLSGNTSLLGFILEKATGMTLSDYASEKLWKPLGAEHPAYWSLDKENGHEKSYCCFNSNARDFARFGQLFLNGGKWNGNQIIAEDYVKKSIEPAKLTDVNGEPNKCYGYSWWLMNYKGQDIYYERGILGQYIIVIPKEKMVIVRLGKKRNKKKINDHPVDVFTYIDTALEMYGSK